MGKQEYMEKEKECENCKKIFTYEDWLNEGKYRSISNWSKKLYCSKYCKGRGEYMTKLNKLGKELKPR